MTLYVQLYRDATAFDTLSDDWRDLLRRSDNDSFFLTPAYQRTWWHCLGQGELAVLTVQQEPDGPLLGVAPLFGSPARWQTVGCVAVSDYLDWVTARGREREVLAALLDYPLPWQSLDLCNVHRDSPTLRYLPALARERGWVVQSEVQDVCPVVRLPATWEEYLASLRRKDRHELRRKMRRAEETAGLRWYVVESAHDLPAEVDDFLHLMAQSGEDKAAFLTPERRRFFHELAQVSFAAGQLELSFLAVGEHKVASYFSLLYDNRVLVYNSGLDTTLQPALSAGIVLTGLLLRRAIERGRSEYDFMRGNERYKYRFGGQDVTVHRVLVRREV